MSNHQRQSGAMPGAKRAVKAPARGFSLVEVLASLVLVAVVMPIALRCISLSTNTSSQAVRRMNATMLAQGKLNEIIVTQDYRGAQQQGDFGDDWLGYAWVATTSAYAEQVTQVEVTVTWPSGPAERNVRLFTLVYEES